MSQPNDADLPLPALIRSRVAPRFRIPGHAVRVEPFGEGLIHRSFRLTTCGRVGQGLRYVVQLINTEVFQAPEQVMENVQRVCAHLAEHNRVAHGDDWERRGLSLVPTHDGRPAWVDGAGRWWRVFPYIENSVGLQQSNSPITAYRAAEAFGAFVRRLADLPPPPLHDVLPGLHDTPARLERLRKAFETDACGRASGCPRDFERILARQETAQALADAGLPERVVHNDTKLNNVLFDRASGQPLCVVDLDTVMPGLALHDFGDLVRSAAASAAEDAVPSLSLPLYEALLAGWVAGLGPTLDDAERALLAAAPRVITLELAARFLTDHLEADRYFRIDRPGQNLQRCRSQLHLLQSMEAERSKMERLAREACGRHRAHPGT